MGTLPPTGVPSLSLSLPWLCPGCTRAAEIFSLHLQNRKRHGELSQISSRFRGKANCPFLKEVFCPSGPRYLVTARGWLYPWRSRQLPGSPRA